MATKYATIKGYTKWSKVFVPDNFSGAENWKINLYPSDEKEWAKFRETGLELKVKKDEDVSDTLLGGMNFITFRRPTKKVIRDEFVIFAPPEISGAITVKYVDEEGEKIRQYNKGDKKKIIPVDEEGNEIVGEIDWKNEENRKFLIPNGSLVLVNFSYYDTAKGKGHRLENIRVLEVKEYEVKEESKTESKEPVAEVKTEKKVKKEEKPTISEDLNDKIPW